MKRDLEYLRKMLITIEEADYDKILSNTDFMTDKSSDEEFILASFHISLLLDADFIELEIEPIYAHSKCFAKATILLRFILAISPDSHLDTVASLTLTKRANSFIVKPFSSRLVLIKSLISIILVSLSIVIVFNDLHICK